MGNPLRIVGPFSVQSGYSKMSRAVLATALRAGYDVQAIESDLRVLITEYVDGRRIFEPHLPKPPIALPDCQEEELRAAQRVLLPDDAPTLLCQSPWNLGAWPQYAHAPLIGLSMTESDNLCRLWRHSLKCVDMGVAPSRFVRNVFEERVPEVPTVMMNLPVDDRLWTVDEFKLQLPKSTPPFLFVSVFSTCERKNWRLLMTAFAEEFCEEGKEVGLIVKPSMTGEVGVLAECCRAMGAWVQIDGEKRTDWMMGALYRSCNVYVQPASEGFGLPYVEAALCGLPSIALDKGGAVDVVDERTGYLCPSHMAPILGHMPQYYDRREHKFATCEIDDLRATLRRAYEEERNGARKGEAARRKALQKFTPDAVAPHLRNVVEEGTRLHHAAVRETQHPTRPQRVTLAGNWGDVFCSAGEVKALMADKELPSVGAIFYGRDPKIAEWIGNQPWCSEVLSIIEPDKDRMTETYGRLCQTKPQYARIAWMDLLKDYPQVREDEIAFTNLCLAETRYPKYWRGAVLPEEAHAWADSVASSVEGPFLLLQPLSIASNRSEDHWMQWGNAITWLLENVSVPLVLVGESVIDWPAHPLLVNASGMSKTMMDVLALAERSAGLVTTGNNLGIYGPICGKEAVVCLARTCPKHTFYHRWYEHESISLVEHGDLLSDFQRLFGERFARFMNGYEAPKEVVTESDYYRLGRA